MFFNIWNAILQVPDFKSLLFSLAYFSFSIKYYSLICLLEILVGAIEQMSVDKVFSNQIETEFEHISHTNLSQQWKTWVITLHILNFWQSYKWTGLSYVWIMQKFCPELIQSNFIQLLPLIDAAQGFELAIQNPINELLLKTSCLCEVHFITSVKKGYRICSRDDFISCN